MHHIKPRNTMTTTANIILAILWTVGLAPLILLAAAAVCLEMKEKKIT